MIPVIFLDLGAGWQPAERDTGQVWRWMKGVGEVLLVNLRVMRATLQLTIDVS